MAGTRDAAADVDEWPERATLIDERLVFLARAAARYELVKCCVMDLDEAMSSLFEPAGDPRTQSLLPARK